MESHGELARRYRRLRRVARKLNRVLPDFVPEAMIQRGAKRLGMWHRDVIVFDGEEEMAVLLDYLIYDCYEDGRNAVERYLAEHPPAPGSDEQAVLESMQQAFYAVAQVEEVLEGLGVRVHDVFSDERHLLADLNLSRTAVEGVALASRFLPHPEFVMTSGAALGLDANTLAAAARYVEARGAADRPGGLASLPKEEQARISGDIIRLALTAESSDSIEYADPQDEGTYLPTAPIVNASDPIGRNDPCPCGSGRKYKKCCGR